MPTWRQLHFGNDTMTLENAQRLADKIQQFWLKMGHPNVEVWLEKLTTSNHNNGVMYCIRSNIDATWPCKRIPLEHSR